MDSVCVDSQGIWDENSARERWQINWEKKRRNLCEAFAFDCGRLTDYQHWNPPGSCPNTPNRQTNGNHLTSTPGLIPCIKRGREGESWQNVSLNQMWMTAVSLSLPAPLTNFNKPGNRAELSPSAHRSAWEHKYLFATGFYCALFLSSTFCYRATLLQTLNNLWSGTWQSVTNYSTVAT